MDRRELEGMYAGQDNKLALKYMVETAFEYIKVIEYQGEISGVLAIIPLEDDPTVGVGVFFTDDKIYEYQRQFIRQTRKYLNEYLDEFDVIFNYCPSEYVDSLMWLEKICGARIDWDNEYIFYEGGLPFRKFFISK